MHKRSINTYYEGENMTRQYIKHKMKADIYKLYFGSIVDIAKRQGITYKKMLAILQDVDETLSKQDNA